MQEIAHLHAAARLLCDVERKDWHEVIGNDGTFPAPLVLQSNIAYVRQIQENSVQVTACRENYQCVNTLPREADFFRYQQMLNHDLSQVRSHTIIEDHIRQYGQDYRFEIAPNPIAPLRERTNDNTDVGRTPGAAQACTL